MSALNAALPAFARALEQQTDKLDQLMMTEILASLAGNRVAAAYGQQLAVVNQAKNDQAAAAATAAAGAKAAKELEDKLRSAGQTAQQVFSQARTAMTGWAQAASPEAWSTMTDSFKLVAMQLGEYLIEPMVNVARGAQEFADWLQKLSPEAKEFGKYLGYGGGAVIAFGQANMFTGGLLSSAIGGTVSALGGLTLTAGALGVVLVGLIYAAKKLNDWAAAMEESNKRGLASAEDKGFSGDKLHESAEYKRLAAISDPEERRKEVDLPTNGGHSVKGVYSPFEVHQWQESDAPTRLSSRLGQSSSSPSKAIPLPRRLALWASVKTSSAIGSASSTTAASRPFPVTADPPPSRTRCAAFERKTNACWRSATS
jgi:hypothetical protein